MKRYLPIQVHLLYRGMAGIAYLGKLCCMGLVLTVRYQRYKPLVSRFIPKAYHLWYLKVINGDVSCSILFLSDFSLGLFCFGMQ